MLIEIRDLLNAVPFVPFTVRLADGREYRIPTSDHAHVWPDGNRLQVFDDDGHIYTLPAHLVSGTAVNPSHVAN